jgi:preprotein translocase subunit SecG
MENILNIAQVISAILIVVLVLLQQRGTGMGGAFGGGGTEVYSVKRGAEKIIFNLTIVVSIVFLGLGVARLLFV